MRPWLLLAPPLSLSFLLGLAALPTAGNQVAKTVPTPPLEQALGPYFAKHCAACHDTANKAGGLDLKALQKPNSTQHAREAWESVLEKIQTGQMPPKGLPRPTVAENTKTVQQIKSALERADRAQPSNSGRVTAHRLNRAEYNNTVQELLGVDFRPADDFPQDDSGYGFDNIGDVLSLSSSQMEKYVAAAEKIARAAVFGPELLAPTLVRHEAGGRNISLVTTVPVRYDETGLNLPNALHTTHRFPVDGEYLVKLGLNGTRPLGSEPLAFGIWLDGKKVQTLTIDAEGASGFAFDRQDLAGRTVECRLTVKAGDHWIAATVERIFEGLPPACGGPNPSKRKVTPREFRVPPGFPPERIAEFRKRFEERQKDKPELNDARVNTLEIGGPYSQSEGPRAASLQKIFLCGHSRGGHTAACTPKILKSLASRAFRRPATAKELGRLSQLVALAQKNGDSYDEGIALALQAILVSPHFLFRIERDQPTARPNTAHPLTQHELASRLSYFLWSSMPDDTLRACADAQTLHKPGVLEAQIKRMLQSPKSRTLAENFAGQWLQFRSLESVKPDRERFPSFDNYLRMSMRQETELFFDSIVKEDQSILTLLLGKYTFVNERLASFYGIPGVTGPAFRRVDLTGTKRGGILTQASVLTVTSYPNRTSPVLRGKWILENILNAPPPDPPPGVPNLDVSAVGSALSLRQQLEEHRKNPTCASCHSRMDPLGFGLENFDAIGAWRKSEGTVAIDASGSLPDGRTFDGAEGLKTILKADREAFIACFTTKLLTYALGRGLERYDRPTVQEIVRRSAAKNYTFSSLVQEIATSKPFQLRQGKSTQ
jgi:mono/diheme cytochrome c family protein